jgi:ABC-type antimicrobial peptide transport system permease subunit
MSAVQGVDPDQPVERVTPLDRIVEESLADARVYTSGTLFLGILALILTAVGLYGVMSHSATDRLREVSIRMAMGASGRQAVQKLLFDGLRPVLAGTGVGLVVGYWVAKTLSGILFGVAFNAPFEYFAVAALVIAVSALACYLPASRTLTELPLVCLRQE